MVKAFGGTHAYNIMKGTLVWTVEDDIGLCHTWTIPDSCYMPEGGIHLFFPQHFTKVLSNHSPHQDGTHCITTETQVTLQWHVDPAINVASFYLMAGFHTSGLVSALRHVTESYGLHKIFDHAVPQNAESVQ